MSGAASDPPTQQNADAEPKPYVMSKEVEAYYLERIGRAKFFRIPKKEIKRT